MTGKTIGIVGGGLIGLATAWRLAQAGFRVSVFERGALANEASWAGAGMLAPGGELEEPSTFTTLALEARAIYPTFVRELESESETNIDYQECGGLDLAYNAAEWAFLQGRAQRQNALGIRWRNVDPKHVHVFWPRICTDSLTGALFYPDDAIVNPRDLAAALIEACRNRGVALAEEQAVESIVLSRDQALVRANGSEMPFDSVVLAAGSWSSSIGVEGVPELPAVEPVKGHLVGYHQPEQTCNTIVRHGQLYLLQRANGLLIAGASVEHVGWDRSIDGNIAHDLANKAGFVLQHLTETTPTNIWVGFRPLSEQLHVERWHSDALFLAYGHYRNGILLAPKTAADITALICARL